MRKLSKPHSNGGGGPVSLRQRLQRSRLLEIGIAVTFFVVLVYVISMSVRVGQGVSRTLSSPEHVVRLQILNGCGVNGLASRLADGLADYADSEIEIQVVDTDNFDIVPVNQTFVLSRIEDLTAAGLLANRLGLPTEDIGYRPLEHNYRQVSATIVLGEDWETAGALKTYIREK